MAETVPAPLQVVAISGSLHAPSKSTALLAAITAALGKLIPVEVHLIEISEFAADLGPALRSDQLSEAGRRELQLVEAADLLVVASPVYRGSYTGLFKHLFDLVGQTALAGKPVLIAASGGNDRHSLVLEHQLRPLFGFFEAFTLPIGVYARDADYTGYEVTGPELVALIDKATQSAARLLAASR